MILIYIEQSFKSNAFYATKTYLEVNKSNYNIKTCKLFLIIKSNYNLII